MAEVKVLVEGYAKKLGKGWLASSSAVLIKSGGKLIVCDPGCNRKKLLASLKKEKISPDDIDFVFLTHGHPDHSLLAGIFEKAECVTFEGLIYRNDRQLEIGKNVLGLEIKVIATPGHAREHLSLIVETEKGKCAVAGDVFWWIEGEKQNIDINKIDDAHPDETEMKELKESRKKLLKLADCIIPGHGKTFFVKK
ncbi:MAG: MBL fold metallo-hydrolase [archaeon]